MFGWVKSGGKQNDEVPKSQIKRRFHLGLDWGTSATKMVLRDLDHRDEFGAAYILTPEGCEGDYRYPSMVGLRRNKIYFGARALAPGRDRTEPLPSLKSRVVSPKFLHPHSEWGGLCERDLATLFLAHAIRIGMDKATELANRIDAELAMALTLGVPVAELGQESVWRTYYKMIRLARILAIDLKVDPQGEELDDARTAIALAEKKDRERQSNVNLPQNIHLQYLRPEIAATMYWSIRSPVIETGLYSCVDIGAWTTNAGFFRLADRRLESGALLRKDRFSFYGGKCEPPGMDNVCRFLAEAIGEKDFTRIRGREADLLIGGGTERVIDPAIEAFHSTWEKAFHVSYPKERKQTPWESLNVMVVGGGSKVPVIKKNFRRFPGPNWTPPKMVPELGVPKDLYHYPASGVRPDKAFDGDCTFALVAYGLSVPFGEFPDVLLQDMVPDWKPAGPPVREVDCDDIYPK